MMKPTIHISPRYNAIYNTQHFHDHITYAAIQNGQVAGCVIPTYAHNRKPSGEWIHQTASKAKATDIYDCFADTVSHSLNVLYKLKAIKRNKPIDIAIDMHLIPRYDKTIDKHITRSKPKAGTCHFERYITIQCVVPECRLVIGHLQMPATAIIEVFVRKIIDFVQDIGIRLGTVMLDREFFTSGVIKTLDELNIKYLIPCVNTSSVKKAIEEFATSKRPRVSKFVIKGTNTSAPYWITITKRTKSRKKSKSIHDEYIGFATNDPKINPNKYYRRWGIETGYRMIENARARTHSKNHVVRLLYFTYSTIMYNVWVMLNAILAHAVRTRWGAHSLSQQNMKIGILSYMLTDYKTLPKPPPEPP